MRRTTDHIPQTAVRGPLAGAFSGLCATAPMTVVMLIVHRLLPGYEQYPVPPYEITREAGEKSGIVETLRQVTGRGKTRDEHERVSMALLAHFGFGGHLIH